MHYRNFFSKSIICLFTLFIFAESSMGRNLLAKKKTVKVFKDPDKKSTVLLTLKKGESVEELGRKGMYWQVKSSNGKEGFVSVMAVKRDAKKNSDSLSSALREAVQQGRNEDDASNIRNRSAVMGVRGLDDSDDTAFAGNVKPNPRLVANMENITINQDSVDLLALSIEREIMKKMNRKRK